jgi:hypothetical protein
VGSPSHKHSSGDDRAILRVRRRIGSGAMYTASAYQSRKAQAQEFCKGGTRASSQSLAVFIRSRLTLLHFMVENICQHHCAALRVHTRMLNLLHNEGGSSMRKRGMALVPRCPPQTRSTRRSVVLRPGETCALSVGLRHGALVIHPGALVWLQGGRVTFESGGDELTLHTRRFLRTRNAAASLPRIANAAYASRSCHFSSSPPTFRAARSLLPRARTAGVTAPELTGRVRSTSGTAGGVPYLLTGLNVPRASNAGPACTMGAAAAVAIASPGAPSLPVTSWASRLLVHLFFRNQLGIPIVSSRDFHEPH